MAVSYQLDSLLPLFLISGSLGLNLAKTIFESDEFRFCQGETENENKQMCTLQWASNIKIALEFYLVGEIIVEVSLCFQKTII